MAGAGAARSSGPVGIKALAEATQVASTASGYATEYIFRKLCKVSMAEARPLPYIFVTALWTCGE